MRRPQNMPVDYGFGPGMMPQQPPVDYGMGPNPNMAPPQQQMPQGRQPWPQMMPRPQMQQPMPQQRPPMQGRPNPMQQMQPQPQMPQQQYRPMPFPGGQMPPDAMNGTLGPMSGVQGYPQGRGPADAAAAANGAATMERQPGFFQGAPQQAIDAAGKIAGQGGRNFDPGYLVSPDQMQQMMQGGVNSAFGRNPDPGFTMSPGAAQQVAGIMANRGQSPMQAAQGAAQSAMGGGGQKSISQALGLLGLAPAPPRSQTRSPGIRKDGSRISY